MRVGLLTETYLPVVSGVTHFVALHRRALQAMGHDPFVFTFGHDEAYPEDDDHVIRSPAIPLADSGYFLGSGFDRRARELCGTMDILHAQHPFQVGHLAVSYGKRYGIPVVFTNHTRYDLYAHYYAPFVSEGLGAAFVEAYLPGFADKCQLVIVPSHSIRKLLQGYGVTQRIEVIPNGIAVERFRSPAQIISRAELGIPEGAQVLIYVGRVASEKRIAVLVRAFAAVSADLPQAYLVIVGDGPELADLKKQAAQTRCGPRILFTGGVPYDQVPGYLAMADAFATASTTEVHPLSVLEAIAAGLPVLGIHSPGISDIVTNGANGLLAADDLAECSVRLYRLLSDHEMRHRLAQQARSDSQRHDIRATTRRILECYEQVIADYRRA